MEILDQFGKPFKKPASKPSKDNIFVESIRDRWSTYPSAGLTPVKLASIFKQADAGDIYNQMLLFEEMEEKDAHLSSVLQTRKLAVTGLEWEIIPFSEDAQDKKITDFVVDVLDNLPNFSDNLFDALDALGKGFSGQELEWDNGNETIVKNIEWVHPKRFTFFNNIIPKIITDKEPSLGEEIPPFKLWWYKYKARSGHDTRNGIMKVVAWMYLFKNYAIKDWVAFAEIFGMPIRVGKYEANASAPDIDALRAAIASIGTDAGGVISKNTEIQFVESVKQSSKDLYSGLAEFCNAEMSKAILGQTLTTEIGKVGSYAASETHQGVRQDLLESDCKTLSHSIRKNIFLPLVGYNYGWDAPLPFLKFHFEAPEDLKQLSEIYLNLSNIVTIPAEHVYERFGIPAPKNGDNKELKAMVLKEEASNVEFEEIDKDITSLQSLIKKLSANLTKKEMAVIMAKIGDKITAFDGELKDMVIRKVKKEVKDLLTAKTTEKEVLDSFTKFFSKSEFTAEGIQQMEAEARAKLYLRNELKNTYQDTYYETVQSAFPDEELYCYSSGPRDARTAEDSIDVEALTNPAFGGIPLRYPDEWDANPIVQASLRPNDRGSMIIVPRFMLPPEVQEKLS